MKLDVAKGQSDLDYDSYIVSYARFVRGTIGGIVLLLLLFVGLVFNLL